MPLVLSQNGASLKMRAKKVEINAVTAVWKCQVLLFVCKHLDSVIIVTASS